MKRMTKLNQLIRGSLTLALLASLSTIALAGGAPAPKTKDPVPEAAKVKVSSRDAIAEKRARDELKNARHAMKRFAKAPNPSAGLRYLRQAEKSLRIARDRSRGLALDVAREIDRKATPALIANLIKQAEIHLGRGAEKAARKAINAALAISPRSAAAQRLRDAVARAEADDEPDIQGGSVARDRANARRRELRKNLPYASFADRWNARRPNPFRR